MKNMKSLIAVLMCAAIVLGALCIIPGVVVNPVNAEDNGTDELKASYRFTFEDATDLKSLLDNGWVSLYGADGVPKLFSIAELDGNKVLKYDRRSAPRSHHPLGSRQTASPSGSGVAPKGPESMLSLEGHAQITAGFILKDLKTSTGTSLVDVFRSFSMKPAVI